MPLHYSVLTLYSGASFGSWQQAIANKGHSQYQFISKMPRWAPAPIQQIGSGHPSVFCCHNIAAIVIPHNLCPLFHSLRGQISLIKFFCFQWRGKWVILTNSTNAIPGWHIRPCPLLCYAKGKFSDVRFIRAGFHMLIVNHTCLLIRTSSNGTELTLKSPRWPQLSKMVKRKGRVL